MRCLSRVRSERLSTSPLVGRWSPRRLIQRQGARILSVSFARERQRKECVTNKGCRAGGGCWRPTSHSFSDASLASLASHRTFGRVRLLAQIMLLPERITHQGSAWKSQTDSKSLSDTVALLSLTRDDAGVLSGTSRRSRHVPQSPASSPRCSCAAGRRWA